MLSRTSVNLSVWLYSKLFLSNFTIFFFVERCVLRNMYGVEF